MVFKRMSIMVTCLAFLLISVGTASAKSFEFKGIWLRPSADQAEAIEQLDNIRDAGFDAVYVETFYHGFTLYPRSHYVPQRPEMVGQDMMAFYVDECHKRGLEFHAWIEVFYWQVDTEKYPQFPKTPLFEKHPEWMTVLRDGRHTGHTETAHLFAEPAHPQVQRFLVGFMEEILKRYDVDGLNLDYIRYPAGQFDGGYSTYARKKYKRKTGIDPVTIEKDKNNPEWKRWVEFREQQVVNLVAKIKRMKERARPDTILSAAIFQEYYNSRYEGHHIQDWKSMVKEGYLDAICPMAYHPSLDGIERQVKGVLEVVKESGTDTDLYPALAIQRKTTDVYAGSGHPPVSEQQKLMQRLGIPGFSIFCYAWMIDSDDKVHLFD